MGVSPRFLAARARFWFLLACRTSLLMVVAVRFSETTRMQKQERIMNVRDWGGIHNKTLAKSEKKPRLGRSRPGEAIKEWEGVSLR